MTVSYLRGHKIEFVNGRWQYCDTGVPTAETWTKRGCGHCGLPDTPEGHDGCLGTLDENIVMNACCGHGRGRSAYVQFWNGLCITGQQAINYQKILKIFRDDNNNENINHIDLYNINNAHSRSNI